MQKQAITEERQAYEDLHYTKPIDCPEHPGKHGAVLYCQGHRYAGIWECPVTGTSDTHEHGDYQTETVEVDDSHPDRNDGYTTEVYVCGGCGVTVEDADPAVDRAEALADYQIDEARGK